MNKIQVTVSIEKHKLVHYAKFLGINIVNTPIEEIAKDKWIISNFEDAIDRDIDYSYPDEPYSPRTKVVTQCKPKNMTDEEIAKIKKEIRDLFKD